MSRQAKDVPIMLSKAQGLGFLRAGAITIVDSSTGSVDRSLFINSCMRALIHHAKSTTAVGCRIRWRAENSWFVYPNINFRLENAKSGRPATVDKLLEAYEKSDLMPDYMCQASLDQHQGEVLQVIVAPMRDCVKYMYSQYYGITWDWGRARRDGNIFMNLYYDPLIKLGVECKVWVHEDVKEKEVGGSVGAFIRSKSKTAPIITNTGFYFHGKKRAN